MKHGDRIDQHEGRVQLSAWLSEDDGKTWKGGLVLDERKGVSYPDGFQAPDGTIYISYDRNRATDGEILLARFTEEDILAKKLVGSKSKLKMLISRPLGIKKESPRPKGPRRKRLENHAIPVRAELAFLPSPTWPSRLRWPRRSTSARRAPSMPRPTAPSRGFPAWQSHHADASGPPGTRA